MPELFFMKVLNDRTVTFMVSKKLLLPMMKAARARRKWDGPRPHEMLDLLRQRADRALRKSIAFISEELPD
jgi:hypothetical protein